METSLKGSQLMLIMWRVESCSQLILASAESRQNEGLCDGGSNKLRPNSVILLVQICTVNNALHNEYCSFYPCTFRFREALL